MKINMMRKISDAVSGIKECHSYILGAKNPTEVIELLGLCQELATSIGGILEVHEDKVDITGVISMLEEYCKKLYDASCITAIDSKEFASAMMLCNVDISDVEQVITKDIPLQKMVTVFLPYMSSMWDSLESICAEAMRDERWDTYVMPLPYYSISADKKIDKDNFEYDKFDDDLPLVDYRKYSLEELKPDLIFYHNPYDDHNRVTCVHPRFFSRNLLKITSNIVYVPYYISQDQTMEHMPDMPGVKNAWRVVVQKEVKDQYLKKYTQEKVLALGSPKLDAIFNINKQNVPEDWQKKIKDKTVFLLNTHLNSAIANPEKLIDMLDYIMEIMLADDDMAVIWRPHPLMEKTLISFRKDPNMLSQYKEKIMKFCTLSNGIYDNTSNMYMAMAVSHGYIGSSQSSVLTLYRRLKKPVFIIPEDFTKKWWKKQCFRANQGGVFADGYIWQFESMYNALFKFDIKTHEMIYVTSVEKYSFNEIHLCYVMDVYEDWLVMLPKTKKEAILYNIKTCEMKYICMEEKEFPDKTFFAQGVVSENIAAVQLNSSEYYYSISMKDFTCEKKVAPIKGNFIGVSDGNLWKFDYEENCLRAYHIETGEIVAYPLIEAFTFDIFPYIFAKNNKLWLVNREDGILFYWEDVRQAESYSVHNIYHEYQKEKKTRIRLAHISGENLVFCTAYSNAVYRYNVKTQTRRSIVHKTKDDIASYAINAVCAENETYILPFIETNPQIIKINEEKVEFVSCEIENYADLRKKCLSSDISQWDEIRRKFLPYDLKTWMRQMLNADKTNHNKIRSSGIGADIWAHLANEM